MTDDVIHVMPEGDLAEHEFSSKCRCGAKMVHDHLIVHRSFDGREIGEPDRFLEIKSSTLEYLAMFAWAMHWISKAKVVELLDCTWEAFENRAEQFLEQFPKEYKCAEYLLREFQDHT